jgi:hypothetical protein
MLVWLSLVQASASLAADEETDPRWNYKGWVPSMSVTLGVHTTDISGFVIATNSADEPIRPPASSKKYAVTPLLHLGIGLESPELPRIPGHIRLFGNVDYFLTFPSDRNAAGEGDPTGFVVPPGFVSPPEEAIQGTGSQTSIETGQSAYGFTGGMSVPFNIGNFRFYVKPGVSWMRYRWDFKGLVLDAEKANFPFTRNFRGIELRGRGKLYSNGVGPYVALEMEPDHWGPVLVGAFVEAAYYRTLGDRDANITASAAYTGDNLPDETYKARWGIKVDEQFWRASAGIRVYLAAD